MAITWTDIPIELRNKFSIIGFNPSGTALIQQWLANIYSKGTGQDLLTRTVGIVTIQATTDPMVNDFRTVGKVITVGLGGAAAQGNLGFLSKDGYWVEQSPERLLYHEVTHAGLDKKEGTWDVSNSGVWAQLTSNPPRRIFRVKQFH